MSRKTVKKDYKLSTVPVDNGDSGYEFAPPQCDEKGRVIVSPISLVAVADQKPVRMGDRIRRYLRNPTPIEDLAYDEDDFEPDDLPDGHDNPMTASEDRMQDYVGRAKTRQAKKLEKEAADLAEKQKAEKEALRERMRELLAEGSLPTPTPNGGSGAPK